MYNSGPSPAASAPSTPTSPLTPTTPPAVTPAAQTPPVAMVAPQTQPPAQQQPKKNLSLTVGGPLAGPRPGGKVAWAPDGHEWWCPWGPGTHTPFPHSQREQMFAAQEMFKTANKVTRPEKALILGFMAGSRGGCTWAAQWGGGRGPHRGGKGQAPPPSPSPTQQPLSSTENPCQEQGDVIQIKLSEHTEDLPKSDGQGSTTMLVDTVFEMNYATGQWTRFKKYKPMANVS